MKEDLIKVPAEFVDKMSRDLLDFLDSLSMSLYTRADAYIRFIVSAGDPAIERLILADKQIIRSVIQDIDYQAELSNKGVFEVYRRLNDLVSGYVVLDNISLIIEGKTLSRIYIGRYISDGYFKKAEDYPKVEGDVNFRCIFKARSYDIPIGKFVAIAPVTFFEKVLRLLVRLPL